MPSSENSAVIACAGSGKTTRLVKDALRYPDRRIAIVTYTNNNVREIIKKFCDLNSGVPSHVDIMTWFGFLMRECARPYQRQKHPSCSVEGLLFVNTQSARGVSESSTINYYFAKDGAIYSDKIAKFVYECELKSNQRVTKRLSEIYTDIFIDEFQDLAGWDLEIIRMLLESKLRVTLVGDPRQHTYETNPSSKNKQYLGTNITKLLAKWEKDGLCDLAAPMNGTYRCNNAICDFVNVLWPEMEPMESLSITNASTTGIHLVSEKVIREYVTAIQPQLLRYSKVSQSYGYEALNFGSSKGLQFDHVLIIPTQKIQKFLKSGELCHISQIREKFHVALTRARHSVGFVYNGESTLASVQKFQA